MQKRRQRMKNVVFLERYIKQLIVISQRVLAKLIRSHIRENESESSKGKNRLKETAIERRRVELPGAIFLSYIHTHTHTHTHTHIYIYIYIYKHYFSFSSPSFPCSTYLLPFLFILRFKRHLARKSRCRRHTKGFPFLEWKEC